METIGPQLLPVACCLLPTLTHGGSDQFFLIPDTGEDSITDFEDGIDTFVLPVGITFGELTISDNISGDALIRFNSQLLATVENAAGLIDTTDFINV